MKSLTVALSALFLLVTSLANASGPPAAVQPLAGGENNPVVSANQQAEAQSMSITHVVETSVAAGAEGSSSGVGIDLAYVDALAVSGDRDAQYSLGLLHFSNEGSIGDRAEGIVWLGKAAQQQHAEAQLELARIYDRGVGVPENQTQANYWYELASQNGNTDAQYELGSRYVAGETVGLDRSLAAVLFRQAAERGHRQAQLGLAKMYLMGWGVPKNIVDAYAWANIALAQGSPGAEEFRENIRINRGQIVRAQELSSTLWSSYVLNVN